MFDQDQDGALDLFAAASDANELRWFVGNGDGTFRYFLPIEVAAGPRDIAVGDLNDDGAPDLAVACYTGNQVSVILSGGPPWYINAPFTIVVGVGPHGVAIGDLNGDGRPDIGVTAAHGDTLNLLLGKFPPDTGRFTVPFNWQTLGGPTSLALGDFTGDGRADAAVALSTANQVAILKSLGSYATITGQPLGRGVRAGTRAVFHVTATGATGYQWRAGGVAIVDSTRVTGAKTDTLTIDPAMEDDTASAFDCVVYGPCRSVVSAPAALVVLPACPVDFNQSGTVSVQDLFDFLAAFFAGCP